MFLTALLVAQAALTSLTGIVLFLAPGVIPASFGLKLTSDAFLLCYFNGATELSLAFASLAVLRLRVGPALRAAAAYFVMVHVTEGLAGVYAVAQGLPSKVVANSIAHFVIAGLFVFAALRRSPSQLAKS